MEKRKVILLTIVFTIFQLKGNEASYKCYFSLSKNSALTFLSDGSKPLDKYCCSVPENSCWESKNPCNPISEVTCQNSGTCLRNGGCTCQPGYSGNFCEIDIDECHSSPCQNGATCINMVNGFRCVCPPRIYGVLCDTNICHPTSADVIFVLDSSVSMTKQEFNKQLEFVANFSRNVPIGPRDFQISVVTFSYHAHVEFYLNEYKNNASLHDAIMNITYRPGITRTDEGLKAVRTKVLTSGHGIERRINGTKASKFVYVLTDGMSNYMDKTKTEANELKNNVNTITVIGIGKEVFHQELVDIASDPSYVFSVQNFNSLYTVLRQLVQLCDECETSTASDVAIVIDSSSLVTAEQFTLNVDAIMHIIDSMTYLNVHGTHVSVATFSDDLRIVLKLGEAFDKNAIKSKVNMIAKSDENNKPVHLETVFAYITDNIFNVTIARQMAKKFALIFTNGKAVIKSKSTFEKEKSKLETRGVNIVAIGSGEEINIDGLTQLVTDTFNVFITGKDSQMNNLDVLQPEFVYSKCNFTDN